MAFNFSYGGTNRENLVNQGNAWLRDFSRVLSPDEGATGPQIEALVTDCERLKLSGPNLLRDLDLHSEPQDAPLVLTFRQAIDQLPGIELDLRKRLGRVAKASNQGWVDFDDLHAKMAERSARQEIGQVSPAEIPPILSLNLAKRNVAAATGLGVFALAWNSFTLVHCVLMIGGMSKQFGWWALGLLGFYSLFFGAGAAMIYGVIEALSNRRAIFEGFTLTIEKELGSWIRRKTHQLGPESVAEVVEKDGSNETRKKVIVVTDFEGKAIELPEDTLPVGLDQSAAKINAYLAAQKRTY